MEIDLAGLIANAPNLLIAIYVIWRDGRIQDRLLEQQKWMLEQLMKLHPPQDAKSEDIDATSRSG